MSLDRSEGVVFSIPLEGERRGLGQVIRHASPELMVVAYAQTHDQGHPPEDIAAVSAQQPVLMVFTLDIALRTGRWQTLGNAPLPAGVPAPYFRSGMGKLLRVEDTEMRHGFLVQDEGARAYDFRWSVSDTLLEQALERFLANDLSSHDEQLTIEHNLARSMPPDERYIVETFEIPPPAPADPDEVMVVVEVDMGLDLDQYQEISDALREGVSHVGEFGGRELGEGDALFFLYGADADRIIQAAGLALAKLDLPAGSTTVRRGMTLDDLTE